MRIVPHLRDDPGPRRQSRVGAPALCALVASAGGYAGSIFSFSFFCESSLLRINQRHHILLCGFLFSCFICFVDLCVCGFSTVCTHTQPCVHTRDTFSRRDTLTVMCLACFMWCCKHLLGVLMRGVCVCIYRRSCDACLEFLPPEKPSEVREFKVY